MELSLAATAIDPRQLHLAVRWGVSVGEVAIETEPPSGRGRVDALPVSLRPAAFPRLAWLPIPHQALPPRSGGSPSECLDDFTRLAEASPHAIAAFARRWGVLGICQHGLPSTHALACLPLGAVSEAASRTGAGPAAWEPLERWTAFAGQLSALRRTAARVRRGRPAALADARAISRSLDPNPDQAKYLVIGQHHDPRTLRPATDEELAAWSADCSVVRVSLQIGQRMYELCRWASLVAGLTSFSGEHRWSWSVLPAGLSGGCSPLFPSLVLQLAAELTSHQGIAECDACGGLFAPTRRPRSDQRAYCATCSDTGNLAAKRRWWRENRSPAARKQTPKRPG